MKKLFIITAIACIMVGCKKYETKVEFGMIKIRGTQSLTAQKVAQMSLLESNYAPHLSDKEIVILASDMCGHNKGMGWFQIRGFAPIQKDTINNILMMWPDDCIRLENDVYLLDTLFISMRDIVIRNTRGFSGETQQWDSDTIAYIPNSVIEKADSTIRIKFKQGDYEGINDVFNKAFTFIPISGKEWRDNKKAGK